MILHFEDDTKISCNFFEMSEKPLVLAVDNVDGGSGHLLSRGVGVIDDKVLLRAMIDVNDREVVGGNLTDRLAAVLARKIQSLDIKDGAEIVYPLTALVARNLRRKTPLNNDDGTLFILWRELFDVSDNIRRMIFGMALGDRGLHFAAGFVESNHVRATMSRDDFLNYSKTMACTGYQAALGAADGLPGSVSRSVKQNASSILNRFEDARKVMSAIRQDGATTGN